MTASLGCLSVGSGRVEAAAGDSHHLGYRAGARSGSRAAGDRRPAGRRRIDPQLPGRRGARRRSAARTARKSATAATSCTRSMCAPAADAVLDRRQRAGEPLARWAPGDRADEVLARDRQQDRPLQRTQLAGNARSTSIVCAGVFAKSGPGSSISCSNSTPRASASSIRSARNDRTSSTIRPSKDGSSSFCFGAARVCITTSAAPVSAHTSASSGSRRPLTSLTMQAPASIAARATAGL